MIHDGKRHNRLVIGLIFLLILTFVYQILFFEEKKIVSGAEEYDKLEAENELLSAKILLIEKELSQREADLSSDERTISTLRDQIDFLKNNIGVEELLKHKAEKEVLGRMNRPPFPKTLTDEEWEKIEEDDEIEAEIEEVFEDEDDFDESSSSDIPENCPLSEKYTEKEFSLDPLKAKYPTRNDKFLTTVLMNGPNNQLVGLRETIFMAIKLNRSYILPKFFKHDHADPTSVKDPYAEVSPSFRISPSKMKGLINVHPFSDIPDVCEDHQISVFYQLKIGLGATNSGRLLRTCRNIDCQVDDLDCETTESHCIEDIALPLIPEKKPRGRFGQDGNFTTFQSLYDTDHSCALIGFPYMDINFAKNIFNEKILPEDRQLMVDIIKATGRPTHIEEVADLFVKEFINDSGYVALHWRYNDDDWWHGGCDIDAGVFRDGNGDLEQKGPKLCKQLSLMRNPKIFAKQIDTYLSRGLESTTQNIKRECGFTMAMSYEEAAAKLRKRLGYNHSKLTMKIEAMTRGRGETISEAYSRLMNLLSSSGSVYENLPEEAQKQLIRTSLKRILRPQEYQQFFTVWISHQMTTSLAEIADILALLEGSWTVSEPINDPDTLGYDLNAAYRDIKCHLCSGPHFLKDCDTIYIATPPSEADLIKNMRKELKIINPEITVLMQSELDPFVRKFYKKNNCGDLKDEFWEILSLVELETCLKASVFLGSQGSSWSKNTNIERRIHGVNFADASNEVIMPNLSDLHNFSSLEMQKSEV
ncbi:Oidioi.mRNA.OKI2018_I69.chr1.g1144.t1.cds [Oikopleura dioica]|uniref:Oidioi.mRNA.OKI2018_I69.chr1.g1144.t1.cds n=1 Tax=Oikopleura dioica TaxID=34765 RepID=A0ABN7SM19_OIKDI|nr:Oidioi.mRNA.OKI2018_I69.chr1.g1144.t1.cds [Oikopleura dioica]